MSAHQQVSDGSADLCVNLMLHSNNDRFLAVSLIVVPV